MKPPAWVSDVTRMAFCGIGDLDAAAKAGVQVIHTNVVWPYYPLRRDGGGLSKEDDARLREVVDGCHKRGMKLVPGLPPFPPVSLVKAHPDWRVHSDEAGSIVRVEPLEQDLSTRLSCNNGPWGDYLIEVCAELVRDYGVDGFSFDGNYHPRICYCPSCKASYKREAARDLPKKADLDDIAYREYLVWRGHRLEDYYRRLQERIKGVNPDAMLMSWTVNAGRVGQLLTTPREMPTRLNLLFDLPMQEWWLNEPNLGASVAPTFGVAYLRAVAGRRPGGPEAYIISREQPYTNFGLPVHERLARTLSSVANGCVPPLSFGWPGHYDDTLTCLGEIAQREPWITHTRQMPWAALLVSEQTRQFYAYQDIGERFLPHVYGAFRAALEEHLPLNLIDDWDVNARELAGYRVLILPNAAALSDRQVKAIREYVRAGLGAGHGRLRRPKTIADLLDSNGRSRHNGGCVGPTVAGDSGLSRGRLESRERQLRSYLGLFG